MIWQLYQQLQKELFAEKIRGWNNKNLTKRETKLERERERERERVLTSFDVENSEGIEECDGNEIIRFYVKVKMEEK